VHCVRVSPHRPTETRASSHRSRFVRSTAGLWGREEGGWLPIYAADPIGTQTLTLCSLADKSGRWCVGARWRLIPASNNVAFARSGVVTLVSGSEIRVKCYRSRYAIVIALTRCYPFFIARAARARPPIKLTLVSGQGESVTWNRFARSCRFGRSRNNAPEWNARGTRAYAFSGIGGVSRTRNARVQRDPRYASSFISGDFYGSPFYLNPWCDWRHERCLLNLRAIQIRVKLCLNNGSRFMRAPVLTRASHFYVLSRKMSGSRDNSQIVLVPFHIFVSSFSEKRFRDPFESIDVASLRCARSMD